MKKNKTFLLLCLFLLTLGFSAEGATVLVNTYDSQGNPIEAKYQVFKGPNYVGQYDAGTSVDLTVGDTYRLFAIYESTSTDRVEFVVAPEGNTFNFSTTRITIHWSGGYLDYRASGSWRSFGATDGIWNTRELFPNDFYGNTMTFHIGYKWNDPRSMVVEMDYHGLTSIEKVFSQLQLLDHDGNPLAGGKARGGYSSPTQWFVSGETNADGLLLDIRDGSNENLSYEMKFNNSASVVAQQLSSIYSFQTQLLTLRLETCGGEPLDGGSPAYGSGSSTGTWWFPGGNTGSSNPGETEAELFPGTFSFRMQYQGTTDYKTEINFPVDGNLLTWNTTNVTLNYGGDISFGGSTGDSRFFNKPSMELLPGTYTFNFRGAERVDLTIGGCSMAKGLAHIKLIDSKGNGLEGGVATYYDAGWKQAGITDVNGNIFLMLDTDKTKFAFKMNWAGFYQQLSNVNIATTTPVLFQTKAVVVRLQNSAGTGLEGGTATYYASGWKAFGVTDATGNTPEVELLPGNYAFKMNYIGAYQQMSQNVGDNPLVVFSTVPVTMKLLSSDGLTELTGDGKYYASGWKDFGTTTAVLEMLPVNYAFKVYYGGASQQKSQNVGTDPVVMFNTVSVTMKLLSSDGLTELVGDGKYYASGWKDFGTTTATLDMLPVNYAFKVYYGGASQQKSQNVGDNPVVVFNTVAVTMKLLSSDGLTELEGDGKYYASGWKDFGNTTATLDMLPVNYAFKVYYGGAGLQKSQNVGSDPVVVFNTVAVTMKLLDADGGELAGDGMYYASGWKPFGTTTATIDMLPVNYAFKVYYGGSSLQKSQNVGTDPLVIFTGTAVTLHFTGDIMYYASGWKPFTKPTMNLLPGNYPFRFGNVDNPAVQQTLTVEGSEMEKTISYIRLVNSANKGIAGGEVQYYSGGWYDVDGTTNSNGSILSIMDGSFGNVAFKMYYAGASLQKSQNLSSNSFVIYQTAKATFDLFESDGVTPLVGSTEYYASGWKTFGSGLTPTTMELLPVNYSFIVRYGGASQQISQNISSDPAIVYNTVNVSFDLYESDGVTPLTGSTEYYAGGYHTFGSGSTPATMELLPVSYTFKVGYGGATKEASQNAGLDPNVVFNTVKATFDFYESDGTTPLTGTTEYYASGWKTFGSGTTPTVMELLPLSYPFRVGYGGATLQKSQNISTLPDVEYQTALVTVTLTEDPGGSPIYGGTAEYYAGGWKTFGTTDINGEATLELLPVNYPFKMYYSGAALQKSAAISFPATTVPFTWDGANLKKAEMGDELSAIDPIDLNISLFPVPAKDNLTASVLIPETQVLNYRIVDMTGRTVHVGQQMFLKGENKVYIGLGAYDPGQYMFVIRTKDKVYTKKFVIIN
ncbi:T9SS type A sorting domain-containing protein [Saccharicrinis sp. FJH2]|uniref:T9SS type A sorting domain-containing protein n=1 Tax=Saccharicrinis sp. FJH65 TaxID=3344659 RepID=UPI0035F43565